MNDRERAEALAAEIDEELIELRHLFKGRENDRFSFATSFSSWDVIESALRFYAKSDALMDSQYRAGMKAGWNLCVDGDEEGFQERMK